jgi:hypothetical protein
MSSQDFAVCLRGLGLLGLDSAVLNKLGFNHMSRLHTMTESSKNDESSGVNGDYTSVMDKLMNAYADDLNAQGE